MTTIFLFPYETTSVSYDKIRLLDALCPLNVSGFYVRCDQKQAKHKGGFEITGGKRNEKILFNST